MIADDGRDFYAEPAFALTARCPRCGDLLCMRQGRRGAFVGCDAYPVCRYTCAFVEALQDLGARLRDLERDNVLLRYAAPAPAPAVARLVDRALVRLVRICHPDRWGGNVVATELTKEVLALREQLKEGQL